MPAGAGGGRFYLGVPEPAWMERTTVPLFVSHVRLRRRVRLPRAAGRWALDSGGFSELAAHGRWTVTPAEYVAAVRRYVTEVGGLDWAAPQDWMCEPDMLVRTGLTVAEHQARTVENFLELRDLAPELPFVPVVQGWTSGQYVRCVELYRAAGVDLAALPVVGVGSVCRRSNVVAAALVLDRLAGECGLAGRLHGFGLKTDGLALFGEQLATADSQAWSRAARSRGEWCLEGKVDCRNCLHYALEWRDQVTTAADWLAEVPPPAAA